MAPQRPFRSFGEFYPFYLTEHTHPTSRRLHVIGTSLALALLLASLLTRTKWLVLLALVAGYGFAWIGHFFFEHNKPATFQYPGFSLLGDLRLWWDTVRGHNRF
jgi:hypothetical protein